MNYLSVIAIIKDGGNRMYTAGPDGYCGDEDNGQTSAWYVFSALGFYPVCPGTDEYILGAPLFKKATLHFENGKNLVITASDNSDTNRYVDEMRVNGTVYTKNYLKHNELLQGGTIDFKMTERRNISNVCPLKLWNEPVWADNR